MKNITTHNWICMICMFDSPDHTFQKFSKNQQNKPESVMKEDVIFETKITCQNIRLIECSNVFHDFTILLQIPQSFKFFNFLHKNHATLTLFALFLENENIGCLKISSEFNRPKVIKHLYLYYLKILSNSIQVLDISSLRM